MKINKLAILNLAAIACVLGTVGVSHAATININLSATNDYVINGPSTAAAFIDINAASAVLTVSTAPASWFVPQLGSFNALSGGSLISLDTGIGGHPALFNLGVNSGDMSARTVTVSGLLSGALAANQGATFAFKTSGTNTAQLKTSSTVLHFQQESGGIGYTLDLTPGNSTIATSPFTLDTIALATQSWNYSFTIMPEPGTLALFGLGVMPVVAAMRRRRK